MSEGLRVFHNVGLWLHKQERFVVEKMSEILWVGICKENSWSADLWQLPVFATNKINMIRNWNVDRAFLMFENAFLWRAAIRM